MQTEHPLWFSSSRSPITKSRKSPKHKCGERTQGVAPPKTVEYTRNLELWHGSKSVVGSSFGSFSPLGKIEEKLEDRIFLARWFHSGCQLLQSEVQNVQIADDCIRSKFVAQFSPERLEQLPMYGLEFQYIRVPELINR